MSFVIDAKNVVWENRIYTITGYQVHKGKRYAEASYKSHGVWAEVENDDLREKLMLKLEHRI